MGTDSLREALRRAFDGAVRSFDLRALTRDALARAALPGARALVVAAGKAAPGMAAGAIEALGARTASALVVTTDGTDVSALPPGVEVRYASHPLPDERSAAAAARAIDLARNGPFDALVACISGGASAVLEAPRAGLGLDRLRAVWTALLASGAGVADVNALRRRLSAVKGGRLAAAAAPRPVWTAYASDVPGGTAADVGSGPTVVERAGLDEARALAIRHLGIEAEADVEEMLRIDDAPREGHPAAAAVLPPIAVATPSDLAHALAGRLRAEGFAVEVADECVVAARALADRLRDAAFRLAPGAAVVVPCEPSLRVPASKGRGGRAGWVALAALGGLADDCAILAGASDGVDGSSGHAGACVGGDVRAEDAAVRRALGAFDDAPLHEALGTAIPGGATGVNLTDVYVVARRA